MMRGKKKLIQRPLLRIVPWPQDARRRHPRSKSVSIYFDCKTKTKSLLFR
jgi:hypothetical protein